MSVRTALLRVIQAEHTGKWHYELVDYDNYGARQAYERIVGRKLSLTGYDTPKLAATAGETAVTAIKCALFR